MRPGKRAYCVLTSGGDAPGMNAAVRAVTRAAALHGVSMWAVFEGYQGLIDGAIQRFGWEDVGGILDRGGTVIGSARSDRFRSREGRRLAVRNLLERGIDGMVVIGGDGSLAGADRLQREWPGLLAELVDDGTFDAELARAHPHLQVVGLVGSIDNDMFGTDMTIGADTALHRIVDSIDAISSSAASHHRAFVIEVMGRNCGYLAVMAALATGAAWTLIPECPPNLEDWEGEMCRVLKAGRDAGRRHGIVIVAEGARDRAGRPITAEYVKNVLGHRMNSDARVTILGHVQRGGSPSAYDRYQSTVLGAKAVDTLLRSPAGGEAVLLGIRENRVVETPLTECVETTREVEVCLTEQRYEDAMALRGSRFAELWRLQRTLLRARPHRQDGSSRTGRRIAVLHCGGPAPGMNTAVRSAVRLGTDRGLTMLAARNGFRGLAQGLIEPLDWMSVHGWAPRGGAELGTTRTTPEGPELDALVTQLQEHRIDGLLMIGALDGYRAVHHLFCQSGVHPALRLPMVCVPASINNNLPGTDFSIGADSAVNSVLADVDRIKHSAVALHRCFIVEVMGRDCGYLALMVGMAAGAESVYLPEDGITLEGLRRDVERLAGEFRDGKRLGLVIRNERADAHYTADFIARLFEKEGGGLFDVRVAVLAPHVQQGGRPTPFDRVLANSMAARAVAHLDEAARTGDEPMSVGTRGGEIELNSIAELDRLIPGHRQRPARQWWMGLRPVERALARGLSVVDA